MRKRPFQIQQFLALILFVVGAIALYLLGLEYGKQSEFEIFAWLFVGAHVVAVLADIFRGEIRSGRSLVVRFFVYSLQTLIKLAALVMVIPVVFYGLLGAVALGGTIVALFGVALYVVEEVAGYDVPGMSVGGSEEGGFYFGLLLLSGAIMVVWILIQRYEPQERVFDLIWDGLEPLNNWVTMWEGDGNS